jgi:hypothetical protein
LRLWGGEDLRLTVAVVATVVVVRCGSVPAHVGACSRVLLLECGEQRSLSPPILHHQLVHVAELFRVVLRVERGEQGSELVSARGSVVLFRCIQGPTAHRSEQEPIGQPVLSAIGLSQ